MLSQADRIGAAFNALAALEHELLLFAAFWFALGAVDELLVDVLWLGLALSGKGRSQRLSGAALQPGRPLQGVAAVFVPAWR
ncbi:hypothetical protein ABTK84_19210, partial [Acinetobacter baumannii]